MGPAACGSHLPDVPGSLPDVPGSLKNGARTRSVHLSNVLVTH